MVELWHYCRTNELWCSHHGLYAGVYTEVLCCAKVNDLQLLPIFLLQYNVLRLRGKIVTIVQWEHSPAVSGNIPQEPQGKQVVYTYHVTMETLYRKFTGL